MIIDSDGPTPNSPKALLTIVQVGNLRKSLEAIRDLLAERLAECDTKESAGVAKQLVAVLKELDSLPNENEVTLSGDLARRYAARLTSSQDKQSAGLFVVPGGACSDRAIQEDGATA